MCDYCTLRAHDDVCLNPCFVPLFQAAVPPLLSFRAFGPVQGCSPSAPTWHWHAIGRRRGRTAAMRRVVHMSNVWPLAGACSLCLLFFGVITVLAS